MHGPADVVSNLPAYLHVSMQAHADMGGRTGERPWARMRECIRGEASLADEIGHDLLQDLLLFDLCRCGWFPDQALNHDPLTHLAVGPI